MAGQEFDKDIHTAVGREVVAQHGPEQCHAGSRQGPSAALVSAPDHLLQMLGIAGAVDLDL